MTAKELERLTRYFRKTFGLKELSVKSMMGKKDSAELYRGAEFLGLIYKDQEDGELSYNFSMAILDIDLDEA